MAAAPDQAPAREAAAAVLAALLRTPAANAAATGGHGADLQSQVWVAFRLSACIPDFCGPDVSA